MEKEFKISESKVNDLFRYLGDLPFKYSNTIMSFLKQNLTPIVEKEKDKKTKQK